MRLLFIVRCPTYGDGLAQLWSFMFNLSKYHFEVPWVQKRWLNNFMPSFFFLILELGTFELFLLINMAEVEICSILVYDKKIRKVFEDNKWRVKISQIVFTSCQNPTLYIFELFSELHRWSSQTGWWFLLCTILCGRLI